MLRIAKERDEINVVADQIGTPTNAADLAQTILAILPKIKNEEVELYHYSNEGVCSWYDFAKAIFEIKGLTIQVHPIVTSQYPTPAKRPFYAVLKKGSIKEKYKIIIPYWKDSLFVCMDKMT
jgi:dTDP-4-dehydrorhamnose reductase